MVNNVSSSSDSSNDVHVSSSSSSNSDSRTVELLGLHNTGREQVFTVNGDEW